MKYYTKTHEWVDIKGDDFAEVGISKHAVSELGEIVYVELPEVGSTFSADEETANIESVKAASPILSPLGGEVTEVNEDLESSPELINEDWETWIWRLNPDSVDVSNLMNEKEYLEYCNA